MLCRDVHARLSALSRNQALDPSDPLWGDLHRLGCVEPTDAPPPPSSIDELQADLRSLRTERARLGPTDADRRRTIEAQEADVRKRLLDASERSASATNSGWRLTWKGRELLDELGPRLNRVADRSVNSVMDELALLETSFRSVAEAAAGIAPSVARTAVTLDSITEKSTALGLVLAPLLPEQALASWISLMGRLPAMPPEDKALVAEAWAPFPETRQTDLTASFARLVSLDQGRAAHALAVLGGIQDVDGAVARTLALVKQGRLDLASAAVLIRTGREDVDTRVDTLEEEIRRTIPGTQFLRSAAVLVALAPVPAALAIQRLQVLHAWIARYSLEGADQGAPLLTWLDGDPIEVLDDLRLAAEQVEKSKLGAPGFPSLSLGMKLMMLLATRDTALVSGAAAPARVLAGTMTLPPHPGLSAIVSTWHHRSLHRSALDMDRNHPTHPHFMFG